MKLQEVKSALALAGGFRHDLAELLSQVRFSHVRADYRRSRHASVYAHPWQSEMRTHNEFDVVIQICRALGGEDDGGRETGAKDVDAARSSPKFEGRLEGVPVLLRRWLGVNAADSDHGAPSADDEAIIRTGDEEWFDAGVTNRRGQIRFAQIPHGTYSACLQELAVVADDAAGAAPRARRIVIGELGLVITIDEGPAGRARVTASAGPTLAGKSVRLTVGDECCHLALHQPRRGSDVVHAAGLLEQSFADAERRVARMALVSRSAAIAAASTAALGPGRSGRGVLRGLAAAGCAAALLALGGVTFVAVRSAQAAAERDRVREALLVELERQLTVSRQARPIQPSAEDAFRSGFADGRRFSLRTHPGEPGRISLVFDPFLQPPYYSALEVAWNDHSPGKPARPPERVFWAGHVPMEPVVSRDFTARLPTSGQDRVTVELRFHTTGEAMEKLHVPPMLVESVPLILSPQGIRLASVQDGERVLASIASPTTGQQVGDRFKLDFKVQRAVASQAAAGAAPLNMVHVLVRPLDGPPAWGRQYYVVPFRQRVDTLPDAGQQYEVWISLSGLLGSDAAPPEQRPTRFEVLVVELPFVLQGWSTPRSMLNLDDPELTPRVRARSEIRTTWPPGNGPAAQAASASPMGAVE